MKLILVEGIPGSGKTSACESILRKLKSKDLDSRIFMEGDPDHPADYESTAFIHSGKLQVLEKDFPELNDLRYPERYNGTVEGVLIPYGKLLQEGKITESCAAELSKYDVYEMPVGLYKELIVTKLKAFVKESESSETIVITDCCFLQNPLTMLMAKYNEPTESIIEFVKSIEEILLQMDPVLIYLATLSVRETIEDVRKARPAEWFQHVASYYTEQEYGKYHELPQGLEGVIHLLEERMKIEKHIISLLAMPSHIIQVSAGNRDRAGKTLAEIIEITFRGKGAKQEVD
ncbi:hypothetical protein D3H55_16045 [Bacillus salacetis]|uniref:Uncharacterized protein n=1 Tax=Bacillus salacetis TaxID=2315464 RepID=A0A3A1QWX4_9BACI|nr:hypothetical protein [Bacillus salacetis]RIW30896.1 hypothetical protein D3H55_16045 [Bacillus salacetis]